jgi:hypothetical protein
MNPHCVFWGTVPRIRDFFGRRIVPRPEPADLRICDSRQQQVQAAIAIAESAYPSAGKDAQNENVDFHIAFDWRHW